MKVSQLFDKVRSKVKKERKKNKHFDGKGFWQPIKQILENCSVKFKWKTLKKSTVNTIMEMPEYYINGHGKQQIDEKNHFIIQSVRIPTTEEPSIKKLIQLALNIGQYEGVKKSKDKSLPYSSINDFVSSSVSVIDLSEYLSADDIDALYKII